MLRAIRRPSCDRARQHRELVAHQDDVGDPLGDLASGSHRHGEPRLLQRRDVVDAVADHRREAPAVGERPHQRLLLLRRDPAEDRVSLRGEGDPGPVVGQVGPLDHAGVVGNPDPLCDRGDGLPGIAGDQLQVHPLAAHELDRLRGVGAQLLLQHHQGARLEPRRRLAPGSAGRTARPPRRRPRAARRRCAPRACAASLGGSSSAPAWASTSGAPIT